MFKKGNKTSFIQEQINMLDVSCKALGVQVDQGMTTQDYQAARLKINFILISAIFGMEIDPNGKKKIRQNHPVASMEELAQIVNILSEFQENTERRFLIAANRAASGEGDENMDIPVRLMRPDLPELKKFNAKEVQNYILGTEDGTGSCLSKVFITPAHVVELAAIAKKVKKYNQTKMMLLIGGIALVIVGGTIAAIAIYKHKHSAAADLDEAVEAAGDIDVDSIDIDLGDGGDVPSVELTE